MNFLIQIVVGLVLSLAGTLLQQAFGGNQQQKSRTGTRGSTLIGGRVPKYFLIGTVGEPGKREYRNSWGSSGEVPNAYLADVLSFGDLPISGMTGLYVNGVADSVSGSGHVTQGYPVTGDKSGKLWIEFFDGAQTSASSYLTGKFGSDADRPWSSSMIGTGVPYLIATALWDEKVWTSFPTYLGEFQGIPLYDPRKDTTAGGSGSQRWNDQSTWTFSDNSMVIIYNIERGIYYDGEHVWGGTASAAQMPYAPWAAAMDACDEDVDLDGGGTEKRFRGGRRINFNERPAEVVKEFLIGANSRIVHCSDGTVYPLVGVPSEADGSFSDADVLATNKLGTIPFPNLDEVINGATATFRAPQQAWEDKETAPYNRSDLEALDDGRRQIEGLDLGTTFSGTQAQRVLKATIEEGRRFRRHVVALPPEYAVYRPLQVLAWTDSKFDYTAKLFLITVRTRDMWGNVVFGLQEIDPDDHDWTPATDESALNYAPGVTNRPAPQEVTTPSASPAIVQDANGANRRPGIDVFWSSASVAVDVRGVRITIATDDGAGEPDTTVWEGMAPRPALGSARITQGLLPDQDYVVQIEYIAESGRTTTASSWIAVTTPDVGLTDDDLASELISRRNDIEATIQSVREQIELLSDTVARETVEQHTVYSRLGDSLASVVNLTTVLTGDDLATAEDLTLVQAQVDDVTASGLFGIKSVVDEGAGEVTITLAARVEAGDLITSSGIGVGVKDGVGFAFIDADKTGMRGRMVSVNGARVIDWDTGFDSTTVVVP